MLWKFCTLYASKFGKVSSGTGLEKVSFHSNPKGRQCQRNFKLPHNALISHTSKRMLKILQASLQQYMNQNFQIFKLDLEKAEETKIKFPTFVGSSKKQEVPEKHLLLFYWLCQILCVDQNKLENFSRDRKPRRLTCLLRNLYASQEAKVKTGHGKTDWFQIRKGVCQGYLLSPCLFKLDTEYIKQNARLNEAQAGIKTAGRNINNLRYANDITLMAESKEELKRASWCKWKRRVKNLA